MTEILKFISESIWAFFILQLINVILSTIKSVATVKSGFWTAAFVNAGYYGFYTFIIKAIGDAHFNSFCGIEINIPSVVIIAGITILTNLIGVYISLKLLDRIRKDDLWLLKVTVKTSEYESFLADLIAADLKYLIISNSWADRKPIEIYLYNKDDSAKAMRIIKKHPGTKHCCIVTKNIME